MGRIARCSVPLSSTLQEPKGRRSNPRSGRRLLTCTPWQTSATLAQARQMTSTPLAAGLCLDLLLNGTEDEVIAQVRDAIAQAGPRGFVLAPDCVIKGSTPDANLAAARSAAGESFDPR